VQPWHLLVISQQSCLHSTLATRVALRQGEADQPAPGVEYRAILRSSASVRSEGRIESSSRLSRLGASNLHPPSSLIFLCSLSLLLASLAVVRPVRRPPFTGVARSCPVLFVARSSLLFSSFVLLVSSLLHYNPLPPSRSRGGVDVAS
jgi:hypothetical protein